MMKAQQGVILIEGLIGILIFSLGILALVGLQAVAINNTTQSRSRVEASYYANQIISRMWVEDKTQLASYANYGNAASTCGTPAGGASTNAKVVDWLKTVQGSDGSNRGLPGTSDNRAQIGLSGNVVTVRICWKNPRETDWHNYVVTATISNAI
jgi:type IV pilus assembly protein PilV